MRILLRLLAIAIALVIVGIIGTRFLDGPVGPIQGGPFRSGELVSGPEPDWTFVHDVMEVEFQLLEPPRSRTTWILDHAGKAYIPCGYMTSRLGKLWKQWPLQAEKDPRAILRIDGRLYERKLMRITEGPVLEPLVAELNRKYLEGSNLGDAIDVSAVDLGALWIFELSPRDS